MPEFGLINMNGRLYDPMMGRMLSPDPDVTYPEVPLSYNRYAYAMNNPVNFVDPNGENPAAIVFFALVGGVINYSAMAVTGQLENPTDFLGAFVTGAVMGAVGYGAGLLAPAGAIPGAVYGAGSGGILGGVSGALNAVVVGGDIGQAFANGALGGFISGGLMGGFGGYMKARKLGANPWTGKLDPDQMLEHVVESVDGKFTEKEIEQFKKNAEEYYKYPEVNDARDVELIKKVEERFGIKFERGELTTEIKSGNYGLSSRGRYVNFSDNTYVGGFVNPNNGKIHISPYYATNPSTTAFDAVVGHELIHHLHVQKFGESFMRSYSEKVAYRFTLNTYQSAGNFSAAYRTMYTANSLGFWGSAPASYNSTIPYNLPFNF